MTPIAEDQVSDEQLAKAEQGIGMLPHPSTAPPKPQPALHGLRLSDDASSRVRASEGFRIAG